MREKRKEEEKLPHWTGYYFLRDWASCSATWDDFRQVTQDTVFRIVHWRRNGEQAIGWLLSIFCIAEIKICPVGR